MKVLAILEDSQNWINQFTTETHSGFKFLSL